MTATVDQYGACVSARPISSNRIASSRKPSPAPPSASATETPVQPSSASSCQDGSGFVGEEGPRLRAQLLLLGREGESPSARPRQAEHALGDDVAQDLRRAGLDRVAAAAELHVLPVAAVGCVLGEELRVGAEQLERELRQRAAPPPTTAASGSIPPGPGTPVFISADSDR